MNAVREDVALDKMVISVGQLLLTPALTIPEYQRPYIPVQLEGAGFNI